MIVWDAAGDSVAFATSDMANVGLLLYVPMPRSVERCAFSSPWFWLALSIVSVFLYVCGLRGLRGGIPPQFDNRSELLWLNWSPRRSFPAHPFAVAAAGRGLI